MLKPVLKQYCKEKSLFTLGTRAQFDRLLRLPIHDIATCIWILSDTDKLPEDIERELEGSENNDR